MIKVWIFKENTTTTLLTPFWIACVIVSRDSYKSTENSGYSYISGNGVGADASFGHEAIQHLQSRFATPLQWANVNSDLLQQEWDDMVWYSKQCINLVQKSYSVVWWILLNSCDAKKWKNILMYLG